jgi:hypothetical protein
MKSVGLVAAASLALATFAVACAPGRGPVVSAPSAAGFDAARSIDVSSPGQPPPLDAPAHLPARDAVWPDDALVAVPGVGAAAFGRAPIVGYPIETLARRPVVNDTLAGISIVVVYSPPTGTLAVYARSATLGAGSVSGLSFTTAGKLYQSEVVLADRRTKSLWLGSSGRAVAGELRGAELPAIPCLVVDFRTIRAVPGAQVIADPSAGAPPAFGGYGGRARPSPDLFNGAIDPRLPALEPVLGVVVPSKSPRAAANAAGGPDPTGAQASTAGAPGPRAYPVARLADPGALTDGSTVVFRRGGAAAAFDATVDGRALTFAASAAGFVDDRSHSTWSMLGVAESGPMKGRRLAPLPQTPAYWFAWASVRRTSIWGM